jgi:hypothetical protein
MKPFNVELSTLNHFLRRDLVNINRASVLKAALIGAAINAVIGFTAGAATFLGIGAVQTIVSVLACCGGLLIPILTGALYGYFTPGRETLAESATGGALAGLVAGLVYGVISGFSTAVFATIQGVDFGTVMTTTGFSLIGACCGAVIFGSLLGGIGGAVWTAVQGEK